MEIKRRNFTAEIKGINDNNKTVSGYVSTYDWDRTGERFAKGAWELDSFRKNPVVLWAHDSSQLPIAKAITISEDDKGLYSEMLFNTEDEFSMKVFSLFNRGFLNTFSVGFNPHDHKVESIGGNENNRGIVWTRAELLEFSAVPIPANPGARVSREFAEFAKKSLGDNFLVEGKYEIEPESTEQLESVMKNLIALCKSAKREELDEQKLSLMQMCMTTLQDVVFEEKQVSLDEFLQLKEIVNSLSLIIKKNNPDVEHVVSRFLMQFTEATKRFKAN